MIKEIGIIGNDLRINYLRKLYKEGGYEVFEDYKYSNNVIAPIPFTRDDVYINGTNIKIQQFLNYIKEVRNKEDICIFTGAIKDNIVKMFEENNIKYYDLLKFEDVAVLSNIPTAEGAIYTAMEKTNITICGSKCLVLGYGRIGKILSKMLNGIGSKVYVAARKASDLAYIESMGYNNIYINSLDKHLNKFDYIFNTVPSNILSNEMLDTLKKEVCIIDLATLKCCDYDYAKTKDINITHALALPSKIAPLSAAIYLKNKIDELLEI